MTKKRTLPSGIRIKGDKYQAYVRVNGVLKAKTFPLDTPLSVMKTWRLRARLAMQDGAPVDGEGPTLAADAVRYLELVESMPSYKDRKYHIDQWVAALGHRPRASLQPTEILQQLERWRSIGSATGGPLSPATLNLRRTALLSLFTLLDGKHQSNPVKAVKPFREEEKPLALPTHKQAQRAIAAIWPAKYRPDVQPVSQARLWVLYWTGWPSSTLKRVTAAHIDEDALTVLRHGRRKGGGTKPSATPVRPQAMRWLIRLKELKGLGPFNGSSLHHTLKLGCRKAKVPEFSVYALRHLFGTTIALKSKDLHGIAELMGHADPRQTLRYLRHAASARALSALDESADAIPAGPEPGQLRATSGRRSRARTGTRRAETRAVKQAS